MRRALFRRASIPGWLALLLAFAERLYNLIDAWSNIEFLREKLRGRHLDSILSILSATPVQLALLAVGLTWIAVVATRRPAPALQPASPIGELDMHRPPKRFVEQVRDMQRSVHDPYGHELRRLLDLLQTEIAGNLKYRPAAAERRCVRSHALPQGRESRSGTHRALQELSAAYSSVQFYQPPQGRAFFKPLTYHQETEAAFHLIKARASHLAQTAERP